MLNRSGGFVDFAAGISREGHGVSTKVLWIDSFLDCVAVAFFRGGRRYPQENAGRYTTISLGLTIQRID
jgi:hypothetical protein